MLGLFSRSGGSKNQGDFSKNSHEDIVNSISCQLKKGISEENLYQFLQKKGYSSSSSKAYIEEAKTGKSTKSKYKDISSKSNSFESKPISRVLKVENVSKSFGDAQILKNISLDIYQGEVLGIIGLSGSGKTTLLNMLIGFSQPTSGNVAFKHPNNGLYMSVSRYKKQISNYFGFAPQEASFYKRLTVKENLHHFGSLYKIRKAQREDKIRSLLDIVNLKDAQDTLGRNLSGGMQRRLGIACSLIHDPSLIIMDEPTADLDPLLRRDVWGLIRQIHSAGKSVILTSHFLDEVEDLCDKVAIIHNSQIRAYGSPEELKKNYSTANKEIHFQTKSGNYKKILSKLNNSNLNISNITESGSRLLISGTNTSAILSKLVEESKLNNDEILEMNLEKVSLSEIFESIVKQ